MDPAHLLSIACTALAGVLYLWAARLRWIHLGRNAEGGQADERWWWAGIAVQTIGLAIALLDPGHRAFAYGVLAAWAGVAALFFSGRYLTAPSRLLLALPLGAVVLLVAVAGLAGVGAPPTDRSEVAWIARVHGFFMAAHLAAIVAAGAAGALFLIATRQLKRGDPRAVRLPALPVLERLCDRGMVYAAGLLTGGLATGGAAMRLSEHFRLLHPTALLGLVELVLLASILGLHRGHRLSRRTLALAALGCLMVAMLGTLSQILIAHG